MGRKKPKKNVVKENKFKKPMYKKCKCGKAFYGRDEVCSLCKITKDYIKKKY